MVLYATVTKQNKKQINKIRQQSNWLSYNLTYAQSLRTIYFSDRRSIPPKKLVLAFHSFQFTENIQQSLKILTELANFFTSPERSSPLLYFVTVSVQVAQSCSKKYSSLQLTSTVTSAPYFLWSSALVLPPEKAYLLIWKKRIGRVINGKKGRTSILNSSVTFFSNIFIEKSGCVWFFFWSIQAIAGNNLDLARHFTRNVNVELHLCQEEVREERVSISSFTGGTSPTDLLFDSFWCVT